MAVKEVLYFTSGWNWRRFNKIVLGTASSCMGPSAIISLIVARPFGFLDTNLVRVAIYLWGGADVWLRFLARVWRAIICPSAVEDIEHTIFSATAGWAEFYFWSCWGGIPEPRNTSNTRRGRYTRRLKSRSNCSAPPCISYDQAATQWKRGRESFECLTTGLSLTFVPPLYGRDSAAQPER